MTHIQLSLFCFSSYNLNRQYFTWHLICSHFFENHKVLLCFFFLLKISSFTVRKFLNVRLRCLFCLNSVLVGFKSNFWLFFNIIWYIVDTTQSLTVRRDLICAELNSKLFWEVKEYMKYFDFKLFETVAKLYLLNVAILWR